MTLDEIAKLAGVSKTTASYVINGKANKYRISEKTQHKVMGVVEKHNYRPDHAASALRAGSSHSFGLIIPDLENTSYARLAKLLEQHSRKAGYQTLIGCSDDDPATEQKVAEALISRRIDALFVASSMTNASQYYLKLQNSGTPIIAIDRPLNDQHFACIVSENFDAAYQLAQSVVSDKVQAIGLIGAMPDLEVSIEREQGFKALCEQKGLKHQVIYGEHFSRETGANLIHQWIESNSLPDAIATTSYTLLEGVLDVLLKNPHLLDEIKIATFGDNRLLDFMPCKVNSLPQQFELIANKAIKQAMKACAKQYETGMEIVPRKLVIRD